MANLSQLRHDIEAALEEAGIKAASYDNANIKPPVAIIVPAESYLLLPNQNMKMNQWNIGIEILLVTSKGTEKKNADELDDLLEKTVLVLSDILEIDIKNATAPAVVSIKGNDYFGSILSLNCQIRLEGI